MPLSRLKQSASAEQKVFHFALFLRTEFFSSVEGVVVVGGVVVAAAAAAAAPARGKSATPITGSTEIPT